MFKDLLCKLTGKWTRQYAERRVTRQAVKLLKENESYLYRQIRKETAAGESSLRTYLINATLKEKLEQKGYTITKVSRNMYEISWD